VKTVLVVDDEFGITDALGDVLGEEGFHVVVARNGKDGLRRVGEQRPDIILLDYMMPVMDGRDMLKALQADPASRDIPVVTMSALARAQLPADFTPAAFLRKPFDIDMLLTELRRLLGEALA
jgi:CheY-like chemotaxis protein